MINSVRSSAKALLLLEGARDLWPFSEGAFRRLPVSSRLEVPIYAASNSFDLLLLFYCY